MKENERINTIDIAKGIGILLVIIGHALWQDDLIRIYIYTFHMPLFFILSGMVMKSPKSGKGIFADFLEERKLIVSYCVYSILFVIFDLVVRFFIQGKIGLNDLFWDIYQTMFFYGINVLWFLPTLLFAKVLVKWIWRIPVKEIYCFIIGIIFYIVGCLFSVNVEWLNIGKYRLIYFPLIALLRIISMTVYIILGHIMGGKIKEYIRRTNIGIAVCIGVITAVILLFLFNLAGNIDIHVMRMGNWVIAFICAVLGTIMVLVVSILLEKVKGIFYGL